MAPKTPSSKKPNSKVNHRIIGNGFSANGYPVYWVVFKNSLDKKVASIMEHEMGQGFEGLWEYKNSVSRQKYDGKQVIFNIEKIVSHRVDSTTKKLFLLVEWEGEEWKNPIWRCEVPEKEFKKNEVVKEMLKEYKKKHNL